MPRPYDIPPSTNDQFDWIYATPRDEQPVHISKRAFIVKMRIDDDEIVFSEHLQSGIIERRAPLSEDSLDCAAKEYDITHGKWLVFRPRDQVNEVWMKIREKTRQEDLGIAAKVSTLRQGKMQHVICVYTGNYLDKEDVFRVRKKLRELSIGELLYYKPDIYTRLGIYSGTTTLRPWRYND